MNIKNAFNSTKPNKIRIPYFLITLVLYLCIMVNIDVNSQVMYLCPKYFEEIFYIAGIYLSLKWYVANTTRRMSVYTLITGFILGACHVMGYNVQFNQYFSFSHLPYYPVRMVMKNIAYAYGISFVLTIVYRLLESYKEPGYLKDVLTKRPWLTYISIVAVTIIAWVPALLNNMPGVMLPDSYVIINMILGLEPLTAHHPICYVWFVKAIIGMTGDVNTGILVSVVISALVIILLLSYMVYYMIKRKWDIRIILLTFAMILFFTPIKMHAITLNKDMIFAAFMSVYFVLLADVAIGKYRLTAGNIIFSLVVMLGTVLMRKNGVYIVLFTAIALLFFKMLGRKRYVFAALCIAVSITEMVIDGPVIKSMGIQPGSPREMFSLPLQQMACIVKNEDVPDELMERIMFYFKGEPDLASLYYPVISDPVKIYFSEEHYEQDKAGFFKLAIELFIKYPGPSLNAWMSSSYGYWEPTPLNWVYAKNVSDNMDFIPAIQNGNTLLTCNYIYWTDLSYLPIIRILTSIGIIFWIFVAMFIYMLYKKMYKLTIMIMPQFVLWLTCIASPVWNELRYVLPIYTALPVLACIILKELSDRKV